MKVTLSLCCLIVLAAALAAEDFTDNVSIRKDANMPQQNQVNPDSILKLKNFGTFGSNVIEFQGQGGVKAASIEQSDNGQWGQLLRFGVDLPGVSFEYPLQLSFFGIGAKNIYPYLGDGALFDDTVYPTVIRPSYLPPFIGTNGSASGVRGAVPAPQPSDAHKCLKGSGVWGDCGSSLTSKGQLGTYNDSGSAVLEPGANQSVLTADSSTPTGLKWAKTRDFIEHFIPTATAVGTTCAVGSGIYIKGTTPKCTVGTSTGNYAWAGLDFPDATASCLNFQALVPRKWDGSKVEARIIYARINGAPGQVRFILKSSFHNDGSDLSNPAFNADSLPDPLPTPPINQKMTGTFRDVNMTGATAGRLGIFQLCRDASNAADTSTATIRLYEIYMNWPISVGFATE